MRALQLTGDPWAEDPGCYLSRCRDRRRRRAAARRDAFPQAAPCRGSSLRLAPRSLPRCWRRPAARPSPGRRAPPLRPALRLLPRRGAARRHRPGAAAREPRAAANAKTPPSVIAERPRRDADAGVRRRARRRRDRGARRLIYTPLPEMPDVGRGRRSRRRARSGPDYRRARGGAGLRGRPAQPLRRGRDRATTTSPCSTATASSRSTALPTPLRPARRPQVLAGRPLRLPRVARRLGQQVRPLEAEPVGRGARRHQQPQHRDIARRPLARRRQLPAAHARSARRRRLSRRSRSSRPRTRTATTSSRVSAVYQARRGDSFVVALKDVSGDLGGRSTTPDAPPGHEGLVHSHEAGHGRGAWRSTALSDPAHRARPSRSTTSSSIPTTAT